MKTILNLSIALMLLAGTAGAFDFIKMFRTGEINRIYDREEKPPVADIPSDVVPVKKTVMENIEENLKKVKVEPELYSRAPLRRREEPIVYIRKTLTVDTGYITEEKVSDEIKKDTTSLAMITEKTVPPAPVVTATPENENKEPVKKEKKQPKRKFKLSMFSRAPLWVEEPDTVLVFAADTAQVR